MLVYILKEDSECCLQSHLSTGSRTSNYQALLRDATAWWERISWSRMWGKKGPVPVIVCSDVQLEFDCYLPQRGSAGRSLTPDGRISCEVRPDCLGLFQLDVETL